MSLSRIALRAAQGAAAIGALGVGCVAYAALIEVDSFRLRRFDVPVLPAGARPIRILQVSDIHMTPHDRARQAWIAGLSALEPDLVIDTGDNLSHEDGVPYVARSLGRLLDRPGVFVWGSNDYFGPQFKNPMSYLTRRGRVGSPSRRLLPWPDLKARFEEAGWLDLTHRRAIIDVGGVRLGFRGTDDAHLGRDRYAEVAGPIDRDEVDVAIGVTHAPYRRVIDAMAYDGNDLIIAGHTHGGQVCVPLYGALVTNCDLDTARVKGLSQHSAGGHTAWMHVSAGLGTSPFAPVRFACPPEASLLRLVPRVER